MAFLPANADPVGTLPKVGSARGSSTSLGPSNTESGRILAETPNSRRSLAAINPNAEKIMAAAALKHNGEEKNGKTDRSATHGRSKVSRRRFKNIALALDEYEKTEEKVSCTENEEGAAPNSTPAINNSGNDPIEKSKHNTVQDSKKRGRKGKSSALDLALAEHAV